MGTRYSAKRRLAKWLTVTLAALALFATMAVGAALLWRANAKAELSDELMIRTKYGIDQLAPVTIGGVSQWIQIRGNDCRNPVILFIHGGPWTPMMPTAHLFQPLWEDSFTVVQWDQRGVGKSRKEPLTGTSIRPGSTLQVYVDDAAEVIAKVKRVTGQAKVIVIGHSWGSVVGYELARQRPDLLHAYVGTGQYLSALETEGYTFQLALNAAKRANNPAAVAELSAIQPYPEILRKNFGQPAARSAFVTSRTWAGTLLPSGDSGALQSLASAPFLSPAYSLNDAINFLRAASDLSILESPLFKVIVDTDFVTKAEALAVPVFFLEGRHDHITESSIVARHFPAIVAPHKELHWLERSGHFSMIQEPDRFRDLLVERVRPFAIDKPPQISGRAAQQGGL